MVSLELCREEHRSSEAETEVPFPSCRNEPRHHGTTANYIKPQPPTFTVSEKLSVKSEKGERGTLPLLLPQLAIRVRP